MSYQALYRVWRPQSFRDVVGQEHVTQTLQNALLQEKISHAYLFSGPRGTGKTSAAKILAKAVNCEHAPTNEPCNECASCKGITDSSIADVIEIDAASNNGVDEIRDIRDKVKYAPTVVKYKVYIIDEVHMLSIGAFNALLKTLEEPPNHVIFILATTEPHKIPLTILSRCQRFDFKRISAASITKRMKEILTETGVQYDEKALHVIARAADGGMRDALSLLDQTISYSDETVTVEDALTVTGAVSQNYLQRIALAVKEKNVSEGLDILENMLFEGKDPTRFVEDFILFFRDILLYKTAPNLEDSFERAILDGDFKKLADAYEFDEIYKMIEVLSKTQNEMRWTTHPRIFLEVAIIKLCQLGEKKRIGDDSEINALIEKIDMLEKQLQELKEKGVPTQQTTEAAPKKRTQRSVRKGLHIPVGKVHEILKDATKNDLNLIKSRWGDMLANLIPSHAALLKEAEPVASSPNAFIIKFKHEIHCSMAMEKGDFIQTVQKLMKNFTERDLEIVCVPEEQWYSIREQFIKNYRGDSQEEEKNEEDPIVSEAIKLFGNEIIEIKD